MAQARGGLYKHVAVGAGHKIYVYEVTKNTQLLKRCDLSLFSSLANGSFDLAVDAAVNVPPLPALLLPRC